MIPSQAFSKLTRACSFTPRLNQQSCLAHRLFQAMVEYKKPFLVRNF